MSRPDYAENPNLDPFLDGKPKESILPEDDGPIGPWFYYKPKEESSPCELPPAEPTLEEKERSDYMSAVLRGEDPDADETVRYACYDCGEVIEVKTKEPQRCIRSRCCPSCGPRECTI